jgi:2-methylcitrate dehydratase PrpD
VRDPRYLDLAARVRVVPSAECDAIFPNQFPAVLRVTMRGGQVHEKKVLANRGSPQNPLSVDELIVKFTDNASRVMATADARRLADRIVSLPEIPLAQVASSMPCAGTPGGR